MNAGRTVFKILLLAMAACVGAQELPAAELNIVPRPAKIKMLPGAFLLTGETRIVAADRESRRIAGLFNDLVGPSLNLLTPLKHTKPAKTSCGTPNKKQHAGAPFDRSGVDDPDAHLNPYDAARGLEIKVQIDCYPYCAHTFSSHVPCDASSACLKVAHKIEKRSLGFS